MKNPNFSKVLLGLLLVTLLYLAFGFVNKPNQSTENKAVFSLNPPPFVSIARAETNDVTSFLDDEAGMSAYFQASTPIELNDTLKSAFRTIEIETSNYIIGSVPVVNYPESEDVHVYVHVDGWILAYYLASDPVGKIFDWRVYDGSDHSVITTKLENTLDLVASYAGVVYTTATYYDFRYPNATQFMLVAEWTPGYGTDTFEVTVPGTFTFYERSWAAGGTGSGSVSLDDVSLYSQGWAWGTSQGFLTVTQFLPDEPHTMSVWANTSVNMYGGIALVYRTP